jgi:large subunit ribosomal protein L6
MSRIGKQPILLPEKVQAEVNDNNIKIKGPLGELSLKVPGSLNLTKEDSALSLTLSEKSTGNRALWGLYRALITNMAEGVSEGFEKVLEIEGVGYRAEVSGNDLVLNLGYSHSVVMSIPEGIKVEVEKSKIRISGIEKQRVGQFAADIRSKRKPEPYKGKGIKYKGEYIRRKAGKRAAGAG